MNENIMTILIFVVGLLATTHLGLLGWILHELVKSISLLGRIQEQIGRLTSDADSEKDSKRRTHIDFERRIHRLEIKLGADLGPE